MAVPDGRPLFAYKTSDEEFEQLRQLMITSARTSYYFLDKEREFATAWFLYASEWWKRCYEGGAWSWSQLFQAIGMEEPPQHIKRDWVERACSQWKLSDSSTEGKRFLGRVVVNGGLPLRLIESAEGKISRLLKSVLRLVKAEQNVSSARIRAEIDAQKNYLPISYRQPLIIELLAALVLAVLGLKDRYKFNREDDPVAQLNKIDESWMDFLPLRLDGQSANRLLQGLVREALDVAQKHRDPFVLKRGIRLGTDGSERLECIIDVASRIQRGMLAKLLDSDERDLKSSYDLSLRCGSNIEPIGYAVARDDRFVVTVRRNELPESWFQSVIRLEFSRFGEVLHTADLADAASLDSEVPWVFEDAMPWGRLIRPGSCTIQAEFCLISVPKNGTIECTGAPPVRVGQTSERTLWRVSSGETKTRIGQDLYKISCSPQAESDESLFWSGKRLYIDSAPSMVFQGVPKLYRIDKDGTRTAVSRSELYWQVASERTCLDRNPFVSGIGKIVWIKDGMVQTRLQLACLPVDAKIEISSGSSMADGTVWLRSWPSHTVSIVTPNVELHPSRIGNDWQLQLKSTSADIPRQLDLDVHWTGHLQRICIPFPGEGMRFVDVGGQTLKDGSWISVEDLVGLRAHFLSAKINTSLELSFSLQGSDNQLPLQHTLKYKSAAGSLGVVEVRLFELIELIKQMLASTTNLDARVKIEFVSKSRKFGSLQVARYRYGLEQDISRSWVILGATTNLPDEQTLAATDALAINLDYPEQRAVTLEQQYSDDVRVGAWAFDERRRLAGTWLIYPAPGAKCRFRPIIWPVPEQFATPGRKPAGLSAAMVTSNAADRSEAFDAAIAEMALEPGHDDWTLASILLDKLGHLPLAAVDFFVALARNPLAMVMAYLHLEGFSDRIADRVNQELPFEWILTSPPHWLSVMAALMRHGLAQEDERGMRMLRRDLEEKLERMRRMQPCLDFSASLAMHKSLGIADQSIALARRDPATLAQIVFAKSFNVDDSLKQQMYRRADDEDEAWPTLMKKELLQFGDSAEAHSLYFYAKLGIPASDQKFCATLFPMFVAAEVVSGSTLNWQRNPEKLHALRTYRQFDPLWFDDAYYAAMIWAISEKIIEI
jgi:hypothetical protein